MIRLNQDQIDYLKDVIAGKANFTHGLCENLRQLRRTKQQGMINQTGDLGYLFKSWEHFSGCLVFPVPHPDEPKSEQAAQDIYTIRLHADQLYTGEYGKLRQSLAQHILDNCEVISHE